MRPYVVRACAAPWVALALALCLGCHDEAPPAHEAAPPPERVAADEPPDSAAPHQSLPRAVLGVSLGMLRAEAEQKLGALTCHANHGGYQVCKRTPAREGEGGHLELYIHHDRVISVSYEGTAPADVSKLIDGLTARFGEPSLSGMRERDTSGRMHEIYGWKDEHSLYSVRLVWRNSDSDAPQLVGTVTALWDRIGYQQWETENKPGGAPDAAAERREPI